MYIDLIDGMVRGRVNTFTDSDGNLYLEVPGFKKEDLEVKLSQGVLSVTGERSVSWLPKKSISYVITTAAETVEAALLNGVLRIKFKFSCLQSSSVEIKEGV